MSEHAKFHMKYNELEVEFEGDVTFIRDGLLSLISDSLSVLPQSLGPVNAAKGGGAAAQFDVDSQLTTNTIATQLGVKSGPELALAAAAHLTFVLKKEKFLRKEVLAEMQAAPTYYKANMSGNLTKILDTLTKNNQLNLVGDSTYALSATERHSLGVKLAQ